MGSSLVTSLTLMGVNISIGVVALWLLPMRRPIHFMVLMTFGANIAALTLASPTTMNAWNIVGYLANYVALPCLFWKARPAHRLICAFSLIFLEFLFEMAAGLTFSLLGIPLDRNTTGPEIVITRCANIAFFLVAGRVAARAIAKTLRTDEPVTPASSITKPAAHSLRKARLSPTHPYPLFFFTQFAFVSQATLLLMTYRNADARVYAIMLVLIAACLATDAIALGSWRRLAAAKRSQARARALEQQFEFHVSHARLAARDAELAARFRHDERNHLQALMALVSQGEVARARAYARELRSALASGGEGA